MGLPVEDDPPLDNEWRRIVAGGWFGADAATIRKEVPPRTDVHINLPIELMSQLSRFASIEGIPRRALIERILYDWVQREH